MIEMLVPTSNTYTKLKSEKDLENLATGKLNIHINRDRNYKSMDLLWSTRDDSSTIVIL